MCGQVLDAARVRAAAAVPRGAADRDRGGAASRVSAGGGEVSSTMSSRTASRISRGRGHGDTSRDTCVKIQNVNFASTHRLKKRLKCKLYFCGYVDSRYIITWAE